MTSKALICDGSDGTISDASLMQLDVNRRHNVDRAVANGAVLVMAGFVPLTLVIDSVRDLTSVIELRPESGCMTGTHRWR